MNLNSEGLRYISQKALEETISAEIEGIEYLMARAATSGKFSIEVPNISAVMKLRLLDAGFEVQYAQRGYNEYAFVISWE